MFSLCCFFVYTYILCGRVILLCPVVAMLLALCYVVLVSHQYDIWKKYVDSVYVAGYGGMSESLCVFRELCPVSFLVVGKSPWVCCSL